MKFFIGAKGIKDICKRRLFWKESLKENVAYSDNFWFGGIVPAPKKFDSFDF